jgi:hypothetical protein
VVERGESPPERVLMPTKPKFSPVNTMGDPIWRCGVLEIRDVKKNGGEFARNGYDDTFRYNLWVGSDWYVPMSSNSRVYLQKWALENYDPATGKEI